MVLRSKNQMFPEGGETFWAARGCAFLFFRPPLAVLVKDKKNLDIIRLHTTHRVVFFYGRLGTIQDYLSCVQLGRSFK